MNRVAAATQVVPFGIKRDTVRSPAICTKIWFRFVVGCEAEMQLLVPPVAV
jgi:hypothetical protein